MISRDERLRGHSLRVPSVPPVAKNSAELTERVLPQERRVTINRWQALRIALFFLLAASIGDMLDVVNDSRAFEISGIRWHKPITYYYRDGCPSYVLPELKRAASTMSPISTRYGGLASSVGFDERVTVYCAPEPIQAAMFIPDHIGFDTVDSAIGTARRYWRRSTQEIVDCDIWLHADRINPANARIIIQHEWGHCLGLDHEEEQRSIMAPTLQKIDTDDPTINDRAGLNVLYGKCEDELDSYGNHFMHKVPVNGGYLYGIMPAGGVWPYDVHTVGASDC